MRNVVRKILFPNRFLGFLIFNFGFGLLLYVFGNHLEETLIAYVSYLLSFYKLFFVFGLVVFANLVMIL